jgi:hypothetical protein
MIVNPENYFYLSDGNVLKDVSELLEALKTMSPETFAYHVTSEKNDFYTWVLYVIKDSILAKKIHSAKTQKEMAFETEKRLKSLKKSLGIIETKRAILNQIKGIHANG